MRYCRVRGCRVYAELDTLVADREAGAAAELARRVCAMGAHALIAQDLGFIRIARVISKIEPEAIRQVISEETSSLVRYALESVVANGSGKNAYIENYRVGGKTGTAQKVENGSYLDGNYILSFMGFLPADDPEIVVYVAIDNPKGVTQYGGVVSAPIARNVMLSAIDILDIEPRVDGMAKEYTWLDKKYSILPNVVGMSKEEATKTLKNYKIEYTGSGDTVIYMSPNAGYYVAEGETIMLMLGDS